MSSLWIAIQYFYLVGIIVSMLFTYLISRETIKIRCISALTVGLTWPLSLPMVLLFSLF